MITHLPIPDRKNRVMEDGYQTTDPRWFAFENHQEPETQVRISMRALNSQRAEFSYDWTINGTRLPIVRDRSTYTTAIADRYLGYFTRSIKIGSETMNIISDSPLWERSSPDEEWVFDHRLALHVYVNTDSYGLFESLHKERWVVMDWGFETASNEDGTEEIHSLIRYVYRQDPMFGPPVLRLDQDANIMTAMPIEYMQHPDTRGTSKIRPHTYTPGGYWTNPEYEYLFREGHFDETLYEPV